MSLFQSIGGVFTTPPEVVSWGQNDINLFAFAVGTDQALWFAQLDGFTVGADTKAWSGWRSLGGVVMSPPRAVQSGGLSVDVFAVGANSELLHWQFRDGAWTSWPLDNTGAEAVPMASRIVPPRPYRNWESLGGMLTSPPDAIALNYQSGDTGILAFVLGTDHALWIKEFYKGSWQDWNWRDWYSNMHGRILISPPRVVRWGADRFAVFGLGTDLAIWWGMDGQWQSLGGTFSSAPYAVSTSGHIHVFAADTQSALQHISWDGNSWSGWESLGGILVSPPTANSSQSELLHVYAVGTDSAIWRRQLVGGSWSNWDSLGGPFISPPSTIARLPDNIPTRDLVALGTDHAAWHLELFDP